jgi:hypothetical protein
VTDDVPVELFLDAYPPAIRALSLELRRLVHEMAPELIERVRSGWALIGYDLPIGRRRRYLAFIAPETEHVHLGFEVGALMRPRPELAGAHLHLKKVRFLTYRPGERPDSTLVTELVREAIAIGRMSAGERALLAEGARVGDVPARIER